MKSQIYKVLLLEDNPGDVRLVSEYLQDSSGSAFAVTKVNELKAALKELKKKKFDIALTDLSLPDAKGEEILKAIQNEAPSLPLVVLTGTFHEEEMDVRTLKIGAQDYLTKDHLDANILRRAIRHAMERKGIEQELVKKNEQLRELDRLKDEFVNSVSHEFRTPLTVVKGEIDNLLSGVAGGLSEKQSRCLETAQKNINRLVNLLDNILDLSRLESGRAKINFQSLSLPTLLREVLYSFEGMAKKQGIQLKEEGLEGLPAVKADPDLVAQVLTNLVTNAIRFAKARVVLGGCIYNNASLQISVCDDGEGIPPEDQKKLFNKFEQIQRPVGGGYKGTGLGLVICKEIILKHGGSIWVESGNGKGTTFHFTLPRFSPE